MKAELVDLLLEWLHEQGRSGVVEVTPRTVIAVQAIVEGGIARDLDELRISLATLLAHDEASWQLVAASFRRWQAEIAAHGVVERVDMGSGPVVGSSALQPSRAPERSPGGSVRSRWREWIDGLSWHRWVVVLAGMAGLVIATPLLISMVLPEAPVEGSNVEQQDVQLPVEPKEELPAVVWVREAPSTVEQSQKTTVPLPPPGPWWVLVTLALGSLWLIRVGTRWWQAVDRLQRDLDELHATAAHERSELHRQGTRVAVPYHVEILLPLPADVIDAAANVLGRMSDDHPGWELDVEPTITRTVDDGGRIRPVFHPVRQYGGLVVLVDVEREGHPDLHRVERMLERWSRGGLHFHRYDFAFRPARLLPHGHGDAIDLAALARRHESAPLLVISRWARPADRRFRLDWLGPLAAWPNRVWLDLDPRLSHEHHGDHHRHRQRIARSGLVRFPFTETGLLACARTLAAGGHAAPVDERALPAIEVLQPHLEAWAACACLVPDPTWPQLDAIRRKIPELSEALPDPRCVHRLVEWMRQWAQADRLGDVDPVGFGARLEVPPAQLDALRERLRERDRGVEDSEAKLEIQAWRVLQAQLRAADVTNDPLGERMRELKLQVIEAVIDSTLADGLLQRWAGTAVEPELVAMLRPEQHLQRKRGLRLLGRWKSGVWQRYETITGERRGARLWDLLRPRWGWVSWRMLCAQLAALVLAVASYGGWWTSRPRSVEHETTARVQVPATYEVRQPEDEELKRLRRPCTAAVALEGVAPMQLTCVLGGKFVMGSPEGEPGHDADEEPQHVAAVGTLLVGTTEVTQAQWKSVMRTEPFDCEYGCGDDLPAQNITWNEAVEFMNALTEYENRAHPEQPALTACYERVGDSWQWSTQECTGYRLPTETEWEYMARAGTETAYSFGDNPRESCKYGNGADQSLKQARSEVVETFSRLGVSFLECDDGVSDLAKVGSYEANDWGLFDVHGNVYEWTWDWYAKTYDGQETEEGYAGPLVGEYRVLRGGSFWNDPGDLRGGSFRDLPVNLRSAHRSGLPPVFRGPRSGLRCVRVVPPEPSTP